MDIWLDEKERIWSVVMAAIWPVVRFLIWSAVNDFTAAVVKAVIADVEICVNCWEVSAEICVANIVLL